MQPIERYGVIALLSLVVIIAAVVLWDQAEVAPGGPPVAVLDQPSTSSGKLAASKIDQARRKQPGQRAGEGKKQQPNFQAKGWGPRKVEKQQELLDQLARAEAEILNKPERSVPRQPAKSESKQVTAPTAGSVNQMAGTLLVPETKQQEKLVAKPKTKPQARTYVVQSGDTMGQIAVDQLGGLAHLKALLASNPKVSPATMAVGTRLVLPGAARESRSTLAATTPASKVAEPQTPSKNAYHVAEGDSLWRISARELGDGSRWNEIAQLNPKINPNALVKGQALRMPAAGSKAVSVASAAPDRSPKKQVAKRGVVR